MERIFFRLPMVATLSLLAGCVAVSRRDGAERVEALLAERTPTTFHWSTDSTARAQLDSRSAELRAAPLTVASAVQMAWLRNPQIGSEYARLGIAQADVVAASRIGNPTFSGSALRDGGSKITTGLSVPLADLLLLPTRKRFAAGEYERAQQSIGAALQNLAVDVERDWYAAAGAEQVAAMREAIARAAATSAELAQRFYEAGNLNALEWKVEQAAASQARIAATTARAEATRARLALNTAMGLSGAEAQWTLDVPLATPVPDEDGVETLQSLAREGRLDLAAARREVTLLDDALGLAKHWRLLGGVEVGVERERELDGRKLTGPTLSLALPLFNQGQAAIARAQAQLEIGRAELTQKELQIDNDVRLGVERVAAMRKIAEDYRVALVPQRETIVKRQNERLNYMLIGAFELLLAKQQEYDAYQGYLEAVRDYWLARADLVRAIGTRLPSDATISGRTPSVETILSPPADEGGHMHHHSGSMMGMDHSQHDMSNMKPPESPKKNDGAMKGMDHSLHDMSNMNPSESPKKGDDAMEGMDHSQHDMSNMKPPESPKKNDGAMKGMDHSQHDMSNMNPSESPKKGDDAMEGMDHSQHDMSNMKPPESPKKNDGAMKGMDHSVHLPTKAPKKEPEKKSPEKNAPPPDDTADDHESPSPTGPSTPNGDQP